MSTIKLRDLPGEIFTLGPVKITESDKQETFAVDVATKSREVPGIVDIDAPGLAVTQNEAYADEWVITHVKSGRVAWAYSTDCAALAIGTARALAAAFDFTLTGPELAALMAKDFNMRKWNILRQYEADNHRWVPQSFVVRVGETVEVMS